MAKINDDVKYLTTGQFAFHYGVSRQAIHRYIIEGRIKTVKLQLSETKFIRLIPVEELENLKTNYGKIYDAQRGKGN